MSQQADVTVVVKGIKEAKGTILVAAGDMSKPKEMKYSMVEVSSTDDVVCVLKDVPCGKCDLYVYQDLNGDFQLNKDETQIPVEPCYVKKNMTVKDGANEIQAKLMNVREMMGSGGDDKQP
jgi:uncharacterized protein (DUF2141 family)